ANLDLHRHRIRRGLGRRSNPGADFELCIKRSGPHDREDGDAAGEAFGRYRRHVDLQSRGIWADSIPSGHPAAAVRDSTHRAHNAASISQMPITTMAAMRPA